MSIFKAYDIRGIYPTELNEEIAYKVGRAFVELLKTGETHHENMQIIVGRDMRVSGPALTKAVIKGVRDAGANVVYVDLVSTPTFYFAVSYYGYPGGIVVSASHNPKEYNGFKMVRERAMPIGAGMGMETIESLVMKKSFAKPKHVGTLTEKTGILEEQVYQSLRHTDVRVIKPFKIVADAANAMGALYLKALFGKLPCKLIEMNFDLDGTFPAHEADPLKPENIVDLQKRVVAEKADLGISTDGDGDRIFFIDNEGKLIESAIVRGIAAKVLLRERPGAKMGYDVRSGRITCDMIAEAGGEPVLTPVGHSLIKNQMLLEDMYFAGEMSGHFYLNMKQGCYEVPMIVTLKLLEEFSKAGTNAADYVRPLRRYFACDEINTRVRNQQEVFDAIKEKYNDGKLFFLDGVSVEYTDFWFNVRGSNTEPLIRMNLEAKSKKVMEKKRDEVLALIRSYQE